jgi:hypothetical protein
VHQVLLQARHHVRRVVGQPETLGDSDCERLHDGLLGQPVNTVTSMAYVAAGAWLGARAARLERRDRPAAGWYAAFVAITGMGSVFYHGPQFAGAQLLHDLPIAGVVGIGAAVPLLRSRRGRPPVPGWSPRLGVGMAAAAVVAGASYVGGGTDSSLCRPDSIVQLHGLWHVATASLVTMWGLALWPDATPATESSSAESSAAESSSAEFSAAESSAAESSFCCSESASDDTFRTTESGRGAGRGEGEASRG